MHFIAKALDRPGAAQIRTDRYSDHNAHLDTATSEPRVMISGPLVGADGKPEGSFFIYEATAAEVVRDFVERDPFAQGGVWSTLEIQAFDWRRGNPEQ